MAYIKNTWGGKRTNFLLIILSNGKTKALFGVFIMPLCNTISYVGADCGSVIKMRLPLLFPSFPMIVINGTFCGVFIAWRVVAEVCAVTSYW
ncbi:hypothetical protein FKM82_020011 [Ascaphus truei]